MKPHSPWYQLYEFAPPHFPFCGEMAEGWVLDPIDTYTSLFYFVSSYLIYREAQALGSPKVLKNIAAIPLFVTFGSILFHMSFTFVFLIADFLGIFYLNFYGLFINLRRLRKISVSKIPLYSLICTIFYGILMGLSYRYRIHSGILMIPILVFYLGSEYLCAQREKGKTRYRNYWKSFFLISIGYTAMLSEGPPFRLGCEPETAHSLIQLHSLWHFMTAFSMIFSFRFYAQESIAKQMINLPEELQS